MEKAFFNWSSGKDSSLALYKVMKSNEYDIKSLFTVVNNKKIPMHEVNLNLLKEQSTSIGIPLTTIDLSDYKTERAYNTKMKTEINKFKDKDIFTSVFGDIHLKELKKSREAKCTKSGINAVFPLWGMNTKEIMREFIDLGFKAVITSLNAEIVDESFIGKIIDDDFISSFPSNADICGENGEYHSFVYDGPIFKYPIDYKIGSKYDKSYINKKNKSIDKYLYLNLE
ncbi:diphthine--ammonia ligase [Anaerofustis stercorihominis]|uniref:Dph6-related ATP pyrophosphatase n=1 Tax=Anaerofustis stercorihominis TaxID=214853 RepID=UPI00214BC762|nr:diphthine--ammonia ligase [Anaerofustis stercorihominis]MCR2033553.1 diphthine--ammonia ligase [Anaerofustis stercorihominis]